MRPLSGIFSISGVCILSTHVRMWRMLIRHRRTRVSESKQTTICEKRGKRSLSLPDLIGYSLYCNLQSYDHSLTAGTGSDKLNRGLGILFDEVDICLCVLREILEGLAAGQVTEVSVELFVYRLAALQEL